MSDGLVVAPCSAAAARFAVLRWHYSGCLPVGRVVRFGVWERGAFIGAVLFSRGANRNLAGAWGCDQQQLCELTRVALREHVVPVTQVVAAALRALRARNPGLRLVVSYADPNEGHHGGIYQAGNWIYTGRSPDATFFRERSSGRLLHPRVVSESGYRWQFGRWTKVTKIERCDRVTVRGKHRYLMPLDKQMRRSLRQYAKPYPAVEASAVTRPVSDREGQVRSLPTAQ